MDEMDDLQVRRRNQLRSHFTMTANVLLYGYHHVSDGAKVTYQIIDGMDWVNRSGDRKGYAYPALLRIAVARGLDRRTIRRHVAELEIARLITREERPGRPSLLIIEDVSEGETRRYMDRYSELGSDKDVLPSSDITVLPVKKEEEKKRQNLVNDEQALLSGRDIARKSVLEREYLAGEILSVLQDDKSLGYYRKVAAMVEPHRIFEALSIVRQLARERRIRRNRGAAFVSLIREHVTTQTDSIAED